MNRLLVKVFTAVLFASLFIAAPVVADEIRHALLDIKEQKTGLFAVTWKVPTRDNKSLAITPYLPANLELVGKETGSDPGYYLPYFIEIDININHLLWSDPLVG